MERDSILPPLFKESKTMHILGHEATGIGSRQHRAYMEFNV